MKNAIFYRRVSIKFIWSMIKNITNLSLDFQISINFSLRRNIATHGKFFFSHFNFPFSRQQLLTSSSSWSLFHCGAHVTEKEKENSIISREHNEELAPYPHRWAARDNLLLLQKQTNAQSGVPAERTIVRRLSKRGKKKFSPHLDSRRLRKSSRARSDALDSIRSLREHKVGWFRV